MVLTKPAYYHIGTKLKNETFWKCNFQLKDVSKVCNATDFWKDVVEAWAVYNFRSPANADEIQDQIIWYNSYLRIDNIPLE